MPGFDMADYKEVSERLAELFAKHPDASLRGNYEFVTIGEQARVVYRAECYRTPDDPAPAVGTAWEDIPGKTPYTRGSELQNAETSAWGRAIVAAGASTSKRIASADEMRSAQSRQGSPPALGDSAGAGASEPPPDAPAISKARREKLKSKCVALNEFPGVSIADEREALHLPLVDSCSLEQIEAFERMVDEIEKRLEAPFVKPTGEVVDGRLVAEAKS